MTSRTGFWSAAVAALVVAAGVALRADDQQLALRLWILRLPGDVLSVAAADMDGDGDRDLVVAHGSPQGRQVSVFLQGGLGERFAQQPAWRWSVPREACALVAGDLDPSPGGEVLFLCPKQLLLGFNRGASKRLAEVDTFFDYPEGNALPVYDLAWDLDGDGPIEVAVPTKRGYTIFARTAKTALAPRSSLEVPVRLRFGPSFETILLDRFLTASSRLRRLTVADLNSDGRPDLVAYRAKGVARFLQGPDGSFPERPVGMSPLLSLQRAKRRDGQGSEEGFDNVRVALQDVDADGWVDLVVTRTEGELGVFETLRTQQSICRGHPAVSKLGPLAGAPQVSWDEARPDVSINLKGVTDEPLLIDWDGDGRRDLILSSYRMDMFTNLARAVTDSLTVTYLIFKQRAAADEGLFPSEPDYTLDVEVPLDALQRRGGHKAALFEPDLNGDGVRDRVERTPTGGLRVVVGQVRDGAVGFAEDRPIELKVGRTEPPWVVDLDGDGRDELILEPFSGSSLRRTVRVVGVAR